MPTQQTPKQLTDKNLLQQIASILSKVIESMAQRGETASEIYVSRATTALEEQGFGLSLKKVNRGNSQDLSVSSQGQSITSWHLMRNLGGKGDDLTHLRQDKVQQRLEAYKTNPEPTLIKSAVEQIRSVDNPNIAKTAPQPNLQNQVVEPTTINLPNAHAKTPVVEETEVDDFYIPDATEIEFEYDMEVEENDIATPTEELEAQTIPEPTLQSENLPDVSPQQTELEAKYQKLNKVNQSLDTWVDPTADQLAQTLDSLEGSDFNAIISANKIQIEAIAAAIRGGVEGYNESALANALNLQNQLVGAEATKNRLQTGIQTKLKSLNEAEIAASQPKSKRAKNSSKTVEIESSLPTEPETFHQEEIPKQQTEPQAQETQTTPAQSRESDTIYKPDKVEELLQSDNGIGDKIAALEAVLHQQLAILQQEIEILQKLDQQIEVKLQQISQSLQLEEEIDEVAQENSAGTAKVTEQERLLNILNTRSSSEVQDILNDYNLQLAVTAESVSLKNRDMGDAVVFSGQINSQADPSINSRLDIEVIQELIEDLADLPEKTQKEINIELSSEVTQEPELALSSR